MKVLQINVMVNTGSTGRIAEEIGKVVLAQGHESYIASGRRGGPSTSVNLNIGTKLDVGVHWLISRLLDRHGQASVRASKALIKEIEKIDPDLIHLHNIHGYYLNMKILFTYLRSSGKPVVWTLHDCWSFTGHCSFFDRYECTKWQSKCFDCPATQNYPRSWFIDHSSSNFELKKRLFSGLENLQIVVPSGWLKGLVQKSFLKEIDTQVIYNGVDMNNFAPVQEEGVKARYMLSDRPMVLGVANVWNRRKGLDDFIALNEQHGGDMEIVLLGLSKAQIEALPDGMTGITRTESLHEMAALYSQASVFMNLTSSDNFPTTNIEALACGTPVITYRTGGSPEAVDARTGMVVERHDIDDLYKQLRIIIDNGKEYYTQACRRRAEEHYNMLERAGDYLKLYQDLLNK